jgi:hypothetical protein
MFSKATVALAVGLALLTATVRLPAAVPCFVTNTPSEKACEPGCCANKTCCATSHERTGPPVQPLNKSSSDQQNIATIAPAIVVPLPRQLPKVPSVFHRADFAAHSPPRLALFCTFLI